MIEIEINYELNKNGERLDSFSNNYCDVIANRLIKADTKCPKNHKTQYLTTVIISCVTPTSVDLIQIENCCCDEFMEVISKAALSSVKPF
jgi:hypothetical protein